MQIFPKTLILAALAVCSTAAHPQALPANLVGRWRIERILATGNPACWDEPRARTLVGTTLRYEPARITWQGGEIATTETLTRTLSRRKYQDEYKVDLTQLGIKAPAVTELDLQHEDADFTGATTEVPGDTVLLAGPGRIVISACGVYYLAVKAPR